MNKYVIIGGLVVCAAIIYKYWRSTSPPQYIVDFRICLTYPKIQSLDPKDFAKAPEFQYTGITLADKLESLSSTVPLLNTIESPVFWRAFKYLTDEESFYATGAGDVNSIIFESDGEWLAVFKNRNPSSDRVIVVNLQIVEKLTQKSDFWL